MKKYLVALRCGGVMEDPYYHWENYQLIEAESAQDAREKYNNDNDCKYYYGKVIAEVKSSGVHIIA